MSMPSGEAAKKLERLWDMLADPNGYWVPESPDEIPNGRLWPDIEIKNLWVFMHEATRRAMDEFVAAIQVYLGVSRYSFACTFDAVKGEQKVLLERHAKRLPQRSFEEHLKRILENLHARNKRRLLVLRVTGLRLEDIDELAEGSWRIRTVTEDDVEEIGRHVDPGVEGWPNEVRDFVRKKFLGKVCVFVEADGDERQSIENARRVARFIVDTLRYAASLHVAALLPEEASGSRSVGVALAGDVLDGAYEELTQERDTGRTTLSHMTGPGFRQPYKLKSSDVRTLKEGWHFSSIWSLAEKEDLTDIEVAVREAVTWIGDAHQETQRHLAFTKYWTSLEALVTGYSAAKVTERLSTAIPILVGQISDAPPSKSAVKKLYGLRAEILHARGPDPITNSDLSRVCHWATMCVAFYLHLRSRGYATRKQVEGETRELAGKKPTKAGRRDTPGRKRPGGSQLS